MWKLHRRRKGLDHECRLWRRAVESGEAVYDGFLLASVTLYISAYLTVVYWLDPPNDQLSAIDLRIRAFGSCAFFMLTTILSIGPLARLDRRFLPLLYNRRHFGVLTFFVVLLHASFMVEWYAVQDALPSLYDELTRVADYGKFIGFPFKALGLVALLILFLMAATSHDYWLVFLTPPVWKGLHMALYVAYGLVVDIESPQLLPPRFFDHDRGYRFDPCASTTVFRFAVAVLSRK